MTMEQSIVATGSIMSIRSTLRSRSIGHSKTRAKSPQSNGICERFHKTMLNEFYQVAFRKKLYRSLDEIQRMRMHG